MITRYGDVQDEQFSRYRKRLHSMVHWLLIYKETNSFTLNSYFDTVQFKLNGLLSLLNNSSEVIELMVLIECARKEFIKGDSCDDRKYRGAILDAHSIIDSIGKEP